MKTEGGGGEEKKNEETWRRHERDASRADSGS